MFNGAGPRELRLEARGIWRLAPPGGVFAQGRGSHALSTQGRGGVIQPPAKCVALRCPRPSARENNALVTTTRGGVSAPFGTLFWRSLKIKFSCNLGPGMAFWRCGVLPGHLLPHVGLSRREVMERRPRGQGRWSKFAGWYFRFHALRCVLWRRAFRVWLGGGGGFSNSCVVSCCEPSRTLTPAATHSAPASRGSG